MSWIHIKPHVFNTTSWRCPPWQSRHCCTSPRYTCHDATYSVLRNIRNLLTNCIFKAVNVFLWGCLKAQVFTHTLSEINRLKNVIRQEIANVTQDTVSRVMASVPGRWQHCLDCHGGHLQDVVLKTWGFLWIQDTDLLDRVQLCLLLCTVNVLSYFQNG